MGQLEDVLGGFSATGGQIHQPEEALDLLRAGQPIEVAKTHGGQRRILKLETFLGSDRALLLAADLGLGLLPEAFEFADAAPLQVTSKGGLDP